MIPIPGTKRIPYLEENAASVRIDAVAGGARSPERALGSHDRHPFRRSRLDQSLDAEAELS